MSQIGPEINRWRAGKSNITMQVFKFYANGYEVAKFSTLIIGLQEMEGPLTTKSFKFVTARLWPIVRPEYPWYRKT